VGLANTRARLARLYGEAARVDVENSEHGGAAITLVLPMRAGQ
jgi:sensor histidine kinase YesM